MRSTNVRFGNACCAEALGMLQDQSIVLTAYNGFFSDISAESRDTSSCQVKLNLEFEKLSEEINEMRAWSELIDEAIVTMRNAKVGLLARV